MKIEIENESFVKEHNVGSVYFDGISRYLLVYIEDQDVYTFVDLETGVSEGTCFRDMESLEKENKEDVEVFAKLIIK